MKTNSLPVCALLLLLLCISNNIFAQAPTFQWARAFNGSSHEYARSMVVDNSGNLLTLGYFEGTVDFDPGPGTTNISASGNSDLFLSKLDAAGNFVWVKRIGNPYSTFGASIVLDNTGNMYLTGTFGGSLDVDPGPGTFSINAPGTSAAFVLKLDASANFVWGASVGGNGQTGGTALAVDGAGNVYATGGFYFDADFDPGAGTFSMTSMGGYDIYILKLNASGNFVWAKKFGGTADDYSTALCLDGSANVFTTGRYTSTVDFDPGAGTMNMTGTGNYDIFVSKLNNAGNFVWARSMGGSGIDWDNGTAIVTDPSGNVYAAGHFDGTCDFDPGPGTYNLSVAGQTDAFMVELNPAGNFIMARCFGGPGIDQAQGIALDVSGNICMTGAFGLTADFDPGPGTYTLSAAGNTDVFVTQLDPSGNFTWARGFGGLDYDAALCMALDGNGSIFSGGYFWDVGDFDPGAGTYTLSHIQFRDAFVHKMNVGCSAPAKPLDATASNKKTICINSAATLIAVGGGTLTWYSSPTSTAPLQTGTVYVTPTLSPGTYTYYVQATTCTNSITRTEITVTVSTCTEIEDATRYLFPVVICPNPFQVAAIFEINSEMKATEFRISDALGRQIRSIPVDGRKIMIRREDAPVGIYYYAVLSDSKIVAIGKFVIAD